MKNIIERIAGGAKIARYLPKAVSTRLAVAALAALAAGGAGAETIQNNPVTGETETYVNRFTGSTDGTGTEWNDTANWDTAVTPFISGAGGYSSALVDGKTVSTTTNIDGWNLQVGAYNGASITWNPLGKIQGDSTMWLTVDGTSSITINGWGGGNLGQSGKNLNYYVAANNGVTWSVDLASGTDQGLTMNYYLAGNGSVSYRALGKATHVIKQADVTLTGTSQVSSKTLVSFSSSTQTFTAAADIKVYDGSTLKETVGVTSVRSAGTAIADTSSTLTTSDAVGSCEIVQCTDGIVLYYVNGDPDAIVAKTYKPSININFTYNGVDLTTAADVGIGEYAAPGTSWNNMAGANGTLSSVKKIDSAGAAALVPGMSVGISGSSGAYRYENVVGMMDLRYGYIDDNANNTTPQVAIKGIPYDYYKLVVYFSNDTDGRTFGHLTINDENYRWDSTQGAIVACTGGANDEWGSSSGSAWTEGGNYLVFDTMHNTDGNLTITGHRGSNTERAGIAAIQIVKVDQQVGENDLLIELDGDETYTFNEAKAYSGTVYVTGQGTVTFAGTASTAVTLDIGLNASVNMTGSTLTPTVVTGYGTAVYTGEKPATGLGWTDSANWQGTLWVTNCSSFTQVLPNTVVNANSILRLTDCSGYFNNNDNAQSCDGTLELVDGNSAAFTVSDGYSSSGMTTFAKLIGDGTLTHSKGAVHQRYVFTDPSEFKGTINIPAGTETYGTGNNRPLRVILGDYSQLASEPSKGSITIAPGATATVASGKTWTAAGGGIAVYGTLNVNGTLAVSSDATTAASGSGTVVFTGRAPTPTGDAWWKNANWTGTVEIKDVANMIGASSGFTGTYLDFASYGNAESKIKISNISGWLPNQTFDGELVLAGTLTINNAISGYVFKVKKLSGNGGITSNTSNNSATTTFQAEDPSAFAGFLGIGYKRVVFGSSLPEGDFVHGQIYVGEGVVVTNQYNANNAWWATGGIKVDGELCSPNLTRFGGTTTITTTDTGVFTLVSNSDTDDMNVDYTRIQGTGTLKYEGTNYRTISTNNFPTALVVENNLSAGLIHRNNGQTVSIGSLSGTGQMRSDWGGSGSTGDRDLRILQAKDTTYSGLFASDRDRIDEVYVAPGASTAGKLTLSGVQTASNGLVVESGASVNLTGTWVGATTVSGTFGGTGTLTGNLTFSAGSTFKAFASDENGLAVSGTVTCPAEGTVTVDVSALEQTGTKVLMTASGLDVSEFALASGQSGTLSVADGALKVSFVTYVAEYNGVQYETVQEAINAAVQAGQTYAAVTILDANATCPAEYYIDTEDNNALKMYQAAIVQNNEGAMTTNFFKTAQLAVDALEGAPYTYSYYSHFEVYSGTAVEMTVNPSAGSGALWTAFRVKVKCLNGATVAVAVDSTEYELTVGTADENGIVTYTTTEKATTYVWAGATSDSATTSEKNYARADNWRVDTSSGATATRAPGSLDTVVFGNGAYASTTASQSVAALQVSGTVTIVGGGSLTSASAITLGSGDSITITGTLSPVPTTTVADSYVKATTSGSTTTYTVATQPTVSDVAFDYGDDFATATVTATVSDAAPSYKLTVGGTEYPGVVSGSTVTFSNVATGRTAAYDDVSYEIAATSGSTAVPLVGDTSGSAEISDTKTWFSHNSSGLTGGAWTTAVNLTEPATVEDNTFTATTESTSSRVVLEFNVCFSATNDADVDGTAQAAIKLGEVESAATFMVLAPNSTWTPVFNADITPDPAEPYKVVLTIDYGTGSYGVTVGDNALTNASGSASFPLAASKTSVQTIDFAGSGTLKSMKGDQVEGYMVVDKNGTRYPTIAAAIAAYNANPTIGPLKVLHAGTAPSGWSIVSQGGIDILKKLAKGFFFMAY